MLTSWEHIGRALGWLAARGHVVFYDSHCAEPGSKTWGWVVTFTPLEGPRARRPRPFFARTAQKALEAAIAWHKREVGIT